MKYRITTLTRTESGTYNESGDILPDMLNGSECPQDMSQMSDWLGGSRYEPADGFAGWGDVYRHTEDENDLLSVTER